MAQIHVSDLTFCYEGSYDNIFEHISFSIDTNWRLGLIGRNGKGKTTFLQLLLGRYPYEGHISSKEYMAYFPFPVSREQQEWLTAEVIEELQPDTALWKICRELELLKTDTGVLYRPYKTLSSGERTKVMLAVLFSRDNPFLLIDEPTNHLDMAAREAVSSYLQGKKGFILVSHDRWLLDSCIDHVLVLERNQIVVEKGNFSTWWENKQKRDAFEQAENAKLKKEIGKLTEAAERAHAWADKAEARKIGIDPTMNHDAGGGFRPYMGEKSRRMQQQRKNIERRQQEAIAEKAGLLKNLEEPAVLKLMPLVHHRETYVCARDVSIRYGDQTVLQHLQLEIRRGDRLILQGKNGSGKSSIIKAILSAKGAEVLNGKAEEYADAARVVEGELEVASGLRISYINQDTSWLRGSLDEYTERLGISGSLFRAVLRQLDMERVQFEKRLEEYSDGQKKKVLVAGSLLTPAHLYIWDEPMNYIDVFSRMQIEALIREYRPTMLIVEHDKTFGRQCGTRLLTLRQRSFS